MTSQDKRKKISVKQYLDLILEDVKYLQARFGHENWNMFVTPSQRKVIIPFEKSFLNPKSGKTNKVTVDVKVAFVRGPKIELGDGKVHYQLVPSASGAVKRSSVLVGSLDSFEEKLTFLQDVINSLQHVFELLNGCYVCPTREEDEAMRKNGSTSV